VISPPMFRFCVVHLMRTDMRSGRMSKGTVLFALSCCCCIPNKVGVVKAVPVHNVALNALAFQANISWEYVLACKVKALREMELTQV